MSPQIGFLYLRYCCNPRDLWRWFKKYMHDDEEFVPSPEGLGSRVRMGDFVREILLDQYYFETIFPRIPKTVADEIKDNLKAMGLSTVPVGNAGQGGPSRRGVDGGGRRPASVKASLSVAMGQRAPNRAGAREEGRGLGSDMYAPDDRRARPRRPRSRSPPPYSTGYNSRKGDSSISRGGRHDDDYRPRKYRDREDHRSPPRRRHEPVPPKRDVRDVFREKPLKSMRPNTSRY